MLILFVQSLNWRRPFFLLFHKIKVNDYLFKLLFQGFYFKSYFLLTFIFQSNCINYEAGCPVSTNLSNSNDFYFFLSIYSRLQSDKSYFSFVTHFLLLQFFFITTLLSCNGIRAHTTIHTFCQNGWRIHYYVFERPGICFYSFTLICYVYFYFFILNLLICERFWTRRPSAHNTLLEGAWFIVDHCWLRK